MAAAVETNPALYAPVVPTNPPFPIIEKPIPTSVSAFDAAELKRKYDHERNKRLNPKGLHQYESINGDLKHLLTDPFVDQPVHRKPLTNLDFDVLIIGGGYGAQMMAIELVKKGITDIRIVEKAGDFGGAWYWNRYPGIQCDIESYVYMPLLEETGYMPTRKYAGGREILQHSRTVGRRFGLYDKALFQTEVQSMHWNEDSHRWEVSTNKGDFLRPRFVVTAIGPLHRPKLPGLPGLETFQGHSFHTSRWDFNYTGGSPDDAENLFKLRNKRVGVVGTGATAVQIIPHLGRWAEKLYVFQRTPSSVDVRGNADTDSSWASSLTPGWQTARMNNFNSIVNGGTQPVDLVSDGWTDVIRKLGYRNATASSEKLSREAILERRQMLDFEKMEQIRQRVDKTVKDPKTAESLKPYYNQFCKRPCFHDEYLPTFNRPNVTLVDTEGEGVSEVTGKGVKANGEEFELDCLIFATGFEIGTGWTQRSGIEVYGRGGRSLREKWEDGPSTLHGHFTRDFPNCLFMQNTQSGLSPNFLHVAGFQAQHFAYMIGKCFDEGVASMEPTQEAEDAWLKTIVDGREKGRAFRTECTPGYYNNEGAESAALDRKASYGGGPIEFMALMDAWRKEDKMEGLETQLAR